MSESAGELVCGWEIVRVHMWARVRSCVIQCRGVELRARQSLRPERQDVQRLLLPMKETRDTIIILMLTIIMMTCRCMHVHVYSKHDYHHVRCHRWRARRRQKWDVFFYDKGKNLSATNIFTSTLSDISALYHRVYVCSSHIAGQAICAQNRQKV